MGVSPRRVAHCRRVDPCATVRPRGLWEERPLLLVEEHSISNLVLLRQRRVYPLDRLLTNRDVCCAIFPCDDLGDGVCSVLSRLRSLPLGPAGR